MATRSLIEAGNGDPFAFKDWVAVGEHQGSVVRVTPRELVIMNLETGRVAPEVLELIELTGGRVKDVDDEIDVVQ